MPTRVSGAMECEALAERANDANDADRKARLREAAKQWVDLAERVEQLSNEASRVAVRSRVLINAQIAAPAFLGQ